MEKRESEFTLGQNINKQAIIQYATTEHSQYWGNHQEQVNQLIEQVVLEIATIDQAALELKLPQNQAEAKKYKAIWAISGSGTYKIPITDFPGDAIYKDKKWAHQTDRRRIDHAIDIIKKISLIASGQATATEVDSMNLSEEQTRDLIREFGPYLVYNGVPCQDDDFKTAIQSGELNFPEEKLFIPNGLISSTLDQVANLKFPAIINFDTEDKIGIITHSPHYPRLLRMVNKIKPIPSEAIVQLFPVIFDSIEHEAEFTHGEIKGIIGYVNKGKTELSSYSYMV